MPTPLRMKLGAEAQCDMLWVFTIGAVRRESSIIDEACTSTYRIVTSCEVIDSYAVICQDSLRIVFCAVLQHIVLIVHCANLNSIIRVAVRPSDFTF